MLSEVYALAMVFGSCAFQRSWAFFTLARAVSSVKGGARDMVSIGMIGDLELKCFSGDETKEEEYSLT